MRNEVQVKNRNIFILFLRLERINIKSMAFHGRVSIFFFQFNSSFISRITEWTVTLKRGESISFVVFGTKHTTDGPTWPKNTLDGP